MVLDEGEQREIEGGEEEHSGQTPEVKNDGVDEDFEGEHGEEPEERFHGRDGERAATGGRKFHHPRKAASRSLKPRGDFVG